MGCRTWALVGVCSRLATLFSVAPLAAQPLDLTLVAGVIYGGTLTASEWSPDGALLRWVARRAPAEPGYGFCNSMARPRP